MIIRPILVACSVFLAIFVMGTDQPTVRVDATNSIGPRALEKRTETAVIRDYLQAWVALSAAFDQNRADLLDLNFVGAAKEKLAGTIQEQSMLGIRTRYRDVAHDLRVVFYSPEGLSIQLLDTVEYDVQVSDNKVVQGTQHVRTRYIAVLTPTEVRWKVRVFQVEPE